MAQALYRKYRSKSLDEIVGQEHVTDVLSRALKNGSTSHAYLLTGSRGVGKTSIARILAHEINKLAYDGTQYVDIIEIDAASNNGVDDIRDLREKVTLAPLSAAKKIYIIDEVHMLSKAAFNALLKTLEEPPEHVVFILATTEVYKLPDTILSRTQRFHFRTIDAKRMQPHLKKIAKQENINISDRALELIAERAKGSFRDAINLLDQLSNSSEKEITPEIIVKMLGLADDESIDELRKSILDHNHQSVIDIVMRLEESGVSPIVLADQLGRSLRQDIVKRPEVLGIIERLIEVGRSLDPQLKLLAITASATNQKIETTAKIPKTISLMAVPSQTLVAPASIATKKVEPSKPKTKKPTAESPIEAVADVPLEWSTVIEHIRTNDLALFSVLHKAVASYKNGTLNLHFSYAIHKKKLDEGKYRQMLTSALVEIYKSTPLITTSHGKIPPKDEQARAVAAIMGGGEEVKV